MLRIRRQWPSEIEGVEIAGSSKKYDKDWNYGIIMNGGRVIPLEEVSDKANIAHYVVKSSPEFKQWLIDLRASGFWREFPQIFANANFGQCLNKQLIRYAYDKTKNKPNDKI